MVATQRIRGGDVLHPRRWARRRSHGDVATAGAKGRQAMIMEMRVEGSPAAQGSKRHVGNGVMVEMSKKLKPWRKAIAEEAALNGYVGAIMEGPIRARCVFFFPRPKHHYYTGRRADVLRENAPKYVMTTPDIDKLLRATYDALTQARVIADDKLIVGGSQAMVYSNDEFVGAVITLDVMPDE